MRTRRSLAKMTNVTELQTVVEAYFPGFVEVSMITPSPASISAFSGLVSGPSFARRQPIYSGEISVMFMPSETRNLQLRIGREVSSSGSWQLTLQY